MWKNKIIIIIFVIFILVTMVIAFFDKNKTSKTVVIPVEKVVIPTRITEPFFSDTGAQDVPMSDEEYKIGQLINKMRNVAPVNNSAFLFDYDYKIDKFVIYIKGDKEKNKPVFLKYLEDTGFIAIPETWFMYTNNVNQ
jgi:hypothetical protein